MSRSTEDRKYLLRPHRPEGSPYYQMRPHQRGWQWVWVEAHETEDVGPVFGTRAEALWSAAEDAANVIEKPAGERLAHRLRLAARAVRS